MPFCGDWCQVLNIGQKVGCIDEICQDILSMYLQCFRSLEEQAVSVNARTLDLATSGVYRTGVDQPKEHKSSCHAEEGEDVGDAAGVSEGVTLANEVVVQKEVGGNEGVEDPDQGNGQGGDDVAVLYHLVQPKTYSSIASQVLNEQESADSARPSSVSHCLGNINQSLYMTSQGGKAVQRTMESLSIM